MKIGMVRYWGRSLDCRDIGGRLGFDSLAHICEDATFYNHKDAAEKAFDFVLFVATPEGVAWLKANRPAKWGKVLHSFYRSQLEINRADEIANVAAFDGILCNMLNGHIWGIFGKPVIEVPLPYAPEFDRALRNRPKKDRVCLIIKHLGDIAVNYLGTLAAFAKTGLQGVVSTNGAYPYHEDTDRLRALIASFGLADRIEVLRPKDRQAHLESIADCRYMLSMDARQSYGRWVVDAASLGVTSVGTYSTMQQLLFPGQLVGSSDVDRAAELLAGPAVDDVDLSMFEPGRVRASLEGQLAGL